MKINNLFLSVQGEAQKTGFPCVFLRLYGCNCRCRYCDTLYAIEDNNYTNRTVEDIFEEIESFGIHYVCITGGEPLLQNGEVLELSNKLLNYGYLVEINTNGTLPIWRRDDARLRWVVDYKLPSSGEWGRFNWENIEKMTAKDDLMFVIGNRADYEQAKDVVRAVGARNKDIVCNFSPVWGKMAKKKLLKWILDDKMNVKFNLQIHKVLWGPTKRGV